MRIIFRFTLGIIDRKRELPEWQKCDKRAGEIFRSIAWTNLFKVSYDKGKRIDKGMKEFLILKRKFTPLAYQVS